MEEIDLENGGTETQIDSVITSYRFYKNKPFEKLTEQKFKKVKNKKKRCTTQYISYGLVHAYLENPADFPLAIIVWKRPY